MSNFCIFPCSQVHCPTHLPSGAPMPRRSCYMNLRTTPAFRQALDVYQFLMNTSNPLLPGGSIHKLPTNIFAVGKTDEVVIDVDEAAALRWNGASAPRFHRAANTATALLVLESCFLLLHSPSFLPNSLVVCLSSFHTYVLVLSLTITFFDDARTTARASFTHRYIDSTALKYVQYVCTTSNVFSYT